MTFQQGVGGYSGCVATYLQIDVPDSPPADPTFVAIDVTEANHGLFRFDGIFGDNSGQIPLGSVIVSARLTLTVPNQGAISTTLHRMLSPWTANDTWDGWGNGIQANGIEAQAQPDETIFDTLRPVIDDVDVRISLQAWSNGAANHGWVLLPPSSGSADGWTFHSCEATTPASRPLLEVEFVQAGVPAVSTWGLVIMRVLVLTAGTVGILRRTRLTA